MAPTFHMGLGVINLCLIERSIVCTYNTKTPQRNTQHYNHAAWFNPLIDHANMRFKQFYVPQQELSIDESLVGTKARSVMTQYIPTKSHKFGIKLWLLVEAATGYTQNMMMVENRHVYENGLLITFYIE